MRGHLAHGLQEGVGVALGAALRFDRCRVNSAHIRQSRPDSGRVFRANVLQTLEGVASSLRGGGYLAHGLEEGVDVALGVELLLDQRVRVALERAAPCTNHAT